MVDLILFGVSAGVVLVLVVVFLVGLYFGRDDIEYGYYYFKFSCKFMTSVPSGSVVVGDTCYVKCKEKDFRRYMTCKIHAASGKKMYNLDHVTWISREEYYAETR